MAKYKVLTSHLGIPIGYELITRPTGEIMTFVDLERTYFTPLEVSLALLANVIEEVKEECEHDLTKVSFRGKDYCKKCTTDTPKETEKLEVNETRFTFDFAGERTNWNASFVERELGKKLNEVIENYNTLIRRIK